MLVFQGGLTSEQVQLLYEDKSVIFEMTTPIDLLVSYNKTSDDQYDNNDFIFPDEKFPIMQCDSDCNQYFYFSKYLSDTLEFCDNANKQNYILVADIDEEILKQCVRCSRKLKNKIEFRVPRKYVKSDAIHDVLYFEQYNEKQIMELKDKYPDHFSFELVKEKSKKL